MTLKECTREELLFVIKRISFFDKSAVERALCDVEYERIKKKLSSAENWGKISDNCRTRYVELLKKNEGKKLLDFPIEDIKEMEQCLAQAKKSDKQYDKLMKEVDAYGKR